MFKLSELLKIPDEARLYEEVAGHFNEISADFYGKANRRLMEELAPKGPLKVLELACGTGALALELAQTLPEGRVVGVDLSEKMLAEAQRHRSQLELENVEFLKKDIKEYLPQVSQEFDLGICCFALSYLGVEFVLRGLRRALKPGGQIGITTSSLQSVVEWQQVFVQFFMEHQGQVDLKKMPVVPAMPMGSDDLKKQMVQAGFENARVVSLIIPLEFDDAEEAAVFLITSGWLSNHFFSITDLEFRKYVLEWAIKKIDEIHKDESGVKTQIEFLVGWSE